MAADPEPDDDPPGVPFALYFAAVVWVAYATAWVLGFGLLVILSIGAWGGAFGCAGCIVFPGVYGSLFLMSAGLQLFGGKTKYLRRAAGLSLAYGVVHFGLTAFLVLAVISDGANFRQDAVFALGTTLWLPGALLIVAGVVGLRVREDEPDSDL